MLTRFICMNRVTIVAQNSAFSQFFINFVYIPRCKFSRAVLFVFCCRIYMIKSQCLWVLIITTKQTTSRCFVFVQKLSTFLTFFLSI